MAVDATTYQTYDAVGNREELADTIWNISPDKTPFTSSIEHTGVMTTHPEWIQDSLATAVTSNAQVEGDAAVLEASVAKVRVGTYTQISDKTLSIAGSQDKTDKAGKTKSDIAYQQAKKGKELRLDCEAKALSNTASAAGDATTTARTTAGILAWLETNADRGTSGADGGFGSGVVAAATNGTQRAFTKTQVDTVMQSCFDNGAEPNEMYVGSYNKRIFSGFTGIAALRSAVAQNTDGAAIVASADVYLSDFGELRVIPSRHVTRDAIFVDQEHVALGIYRDYDSWPLAKNGDSTEWQLLHEYCLLVHEEAGHGVVADLTTS
jgi:hypothetical protein